MEKFNGFDYFTLAVFIAFGIQSLLNGFMIEIVNFVALGISILLTVITSPYVAQYLQGYIKNDTFIPFISAIVTFAVLFIIIKIIVTPMKNLINESIDQSKYNSLDQVAGFVFGLIKAMVFVSLFFMVFEAFIIKLEFRALNNLIGNSFFMTFFKKVIEPLPIIKKFIGM